jgi:hypothetical protein
MMAQCSGPCHQSQSGALSQVRRLGYAVFRRKTSLWTNLRGAADQEQQPSLGLVTRTRALGLGDGYNVHKGAF